MLQYASFFLKVYERANVETVLLLRGERLGMVVGVVGWGCWVAIVRFLYENIMQKG